MRKGLIGLLCLLPLAGCNITPTKAYEGPSRPEKELSLLKGGGSGEEYSYYSFVQPLSVDEVEVRKGAYLISFPAGRHKIELSETLRLFKAERTQYCAFQLESVARCVYTPRPPTPPSDRGAEWQWKIEMPVGIECSDGATFQTRAPAVCGSSLQAVRKGTF